MDGEEKRFASPWFAPPLTAGTSAGYSTGAKAIYAEGFFTTTTSPRHPGFIVGAQADLVRVGGYF